MATVAYASGTTRGSESQALWRRNGSVLSRHPFVLNAPRTAPRRLPRAAVRGIPAIGIPMRSCSGVGRVRLFWRAASIELVVAAAALPMAMVLLYTSRGRNIAGGTGGGDKTSFSKTCFTVSRDCCSARREAVRVLSFLLFLVWLRAWWYSPRERV